jgi:aspartate/tyrosine/aromatic aminotransferase
MNRLDLLNTQFQSQETANHGNHELRHVPMAPADPILGLSAGYKADKFAKKVNLGIGAYRDDNGKPYVFKCVRDAEMKIANNHSLDKEYAPIDGLANFTKGARGVLFGWDHKDVNSGRVASLQTLSGTGALRMLAEFFQKHRVAPIYMSSPTWGNHNAVFKAAGMDVRSYRYFDKKTKGLDIEGMLADLRAATPGSIVLLHTCAHNPTGVDPTMDQWKQIAKVVRENQLYPFFDTAYQGFVTGNLDKDGQGLRYFLDQGFEMCIAQSFAKIMGLYGERTGALHFVCGTKDTAAKVMSQVKIIIRTNYSSPPIHGARIAGMILNDPTMRQQWLDQLVKVTDRITEMRTLLKANLIKNGTKGNWDHVTNQIGMFSFTGLTPKQSDAMVKKHHVYMTKNGRISVCGLTKANCEYVANCIKDVTDNL